MGCFYDMKSGFGIRIWPSVCVCVYVCAWVNGVVWCGVGRGYSVGSGINVALINFFLEFFN